MKWPWTRPGSTKPAWWPKDLHPSRTCISTSAPRSGKPSGIARWKTRWPKAWARAATSSASRAGISNSSRIPTWDPTIACSSICPTRHRLPKGWRGWTRALSLELAIEALGELVAAEKGETSFQLLFGSGRFCYSLLFLNGSPFHVLRVGEGAGAKAASRLRRHREFATGLGRSAGSALKTYLAKGDPLWDGGAVKELKAEPVEFSVALGDAKADAAPAGISAERNGEAVRHAWLLHLGLAQAARQKDFATHNRVGQVQRRRNESIRTRFRFVLAMAATIGVLPPGRRSSTGFRPGSPNRNWPVSRPKRPPTSPRSIPSGRCGSGKGRGWRRRFRICGRFGIGPWIGARCWVPSHPVPSPGSRHRRA